jgi:hypothetical protein
MRNDRDTLLLEVGRQLYPELPAPRAELGVLRRELCYEIGRGIMEHHHDLQQRGQLRGAPFSSAMTPNLDPRRDTKIAASR